MAATEQSTLIVLTTGKEAFVRANAVLQMTAMVRKNRQHARQAAARSRRRDFAVEPKEFPALRAGTGRASRGRGTDRRLRDITGKPGAHPRPNVRS